LVITASLPGSLTTASPELQIGLDCG